ncbi:hypothetical protein COV82_01220 [Candidatus Peregrinibacteria bacterium CG11_big_fil_rev_8_21_14_0_20_46_8]|nr:MAG: hypothetical protein COV82_01220 [Candidatus Peregrinibacteria bacterium CG11_big_fil_rev_8_21_14_0_20_46_8]
MYNTHVIAHRQILRKTIERFLALLVQIKIWRVRPIIIGITGSVGKTSAKEAVATVLGAKYSVYRPPKSYNTEIGLLLGILEQTSGFSSPYKWLKVIAGAKWNAFFGRKYKFWILEYGADKPGDIQHLLKYVKPHVGVITKIERVHQARGQFKDADAVFHEKKHLATSLGHDGIAVLNYDDAHLKQLEGKLKAKTLWWNREKGRQGIAAKNFRNTLKGFSADLTFDDESARAHFPVLGSYHSNIFLPAILLGAHYGISSKKSIEALQDFTLPPGRMSLIQGIHNSHILDSSYNASPTAVLAALELLKELPAERKIAVLGNMNELGEYTEAAHREIGRALDPWLGLLITVGDLASTIAEEALKHGLQKSTIKILTTAEEAGALLKKELQKNDLVLFKGSQNKVRLERAIKMVMQEPQRAKELLCRQEAEWKKIN